MTYSIKRLPEGAGLCAFEGAFDPEGLPSPWKDAEQTEILDYPWLNQYPDHFFAAARVLAGNDGLKVLMWAEESPILAEETNFGGMPCEDSCLEFFLCPFPEEGDRYINIEVNPIGTAHVGVGESRHGRFVYKEAIDGFAVSVSAPGKVWAIAYTIPNSLFIEAFGKAPAAGQKMKGNFYKCSGRKLHEHYGCWNHVIAPRPDFHRPECFGEIVLE